ncbi:MAG: transposase [Methylococcales bacterium]|nr:transposase [Methylococcales bacterium]
MNKTSRKAFKFRLNLTPETNQKLVMYTGGCRFVWNKALALNLDRLNKKQPILRYDELDFWSKLWKNSDEYGFLKDLPSQVLQQKLMDLDKAFKDAFDKNQPLKRLPVFKRKGQSNADKFRYPQGFKIDQPANQVFLPKVGWVRYRNSRKIIGTPKNVTVSRKGKQWYVSIQVEYEANILEHTSTSAIGIDMGVKRFATLSDGAFFEPLNSFKKSAEKLATLQRKLKHKRKFSKNWLKQKAKITQHHEKIAAARHDTLHKISTEICENQAVIVIEDLKINNMSKAAKLNPSTRSGVKQKSGFNKSILDQGWGLFFEMLAYKQDWNGGLLIKVPPQYTSQKCPRCHHTDKANRLTQAEFVGVGCGYENNADVVGAINILTRGLSGAIL